MYRAHLWLSNLFIQYCPTIVTWSNFTRNVANYILVFIMFKKHQHILVMTNPTVSITGIEVECGYKRWKWMRPAVRICSFLHDNGWLKCSFARYIDPGVLVLLMDKRALHTNLICRCRFPKPTEPHPKFDPEIQLNINQEVFTIRFANFFSSKQGPTKSVHKCK